MNALMTLLAVITAQAQTGFSLQLVDDTPVRTARWAEPLVTYWLQQLGSDDFAPEVAVDAVRRGFRSWTAVACAQVTFLELGDVPDPNTTMLSGQLHNGKNEVVWLEGDAWSFGQNVLGVTAPVVGEGGVIVEADIAFNGKDVLWTVTGNGGMDLEGVAVHEIGHFIGIQHNPGPYLAAAPPTMAPYATSDAGGRSLEADDRAAACYLYPWTVWTCASDADCPLFMNQRLESDERIVGWQPCGVETATCEGIIWWVQRLVGFGERCLTVDACFEGLVCHPFAGARDAAPGEPDEVVALCTSPCRPIGTDGASLECPGGYTCETQAPPLSDAGMCVPVDGVVFAPGEGPSGCFSAEECGPGRGCVASPLEPGMKRCAARCELGAAGCPAGMACMDVGEGLGGCFAAAPDGAEGAEGGDGDAQREGDADDVAETVAEAGPVEDDAGDASERASTEPLPPGRGCASGEDGHAWAWVGIVAVAIGRSRGRRNYFEHKRS